MAQYYHMLVKINPLKFKEGNSFFLTCCDCQKQTEGRVCRVSWSAEENAYSAPVTPRVTESYTKKFLDEVFGGNCGEVVAQYSGLNGINSRNYYPIIIEPVPELFLSFGSNFISRIHMDYTNTLHKYERAKKKCRTVGKNKSCNSPKSH